MSSLFSKCLLHRVSCNRGLTCLRLRCSQEGIQASQKRIEDCVSESHDLLTKSSDDHELQLKSLSDRLETSQNRIEAQLQTILTNQQRTRTPIMSHSLDASSPEGRQTWMELGRLLRDEGITPAMIQENRELLVNVMRNTLKNETLAESVPESYATAPEYNSSNHTLGVNKQRNASYRSFPPALTTTSLLGSAPPRSAGFTEAFLERQNDTASSLDQRQNVDNGMQSLLQGMSDEDSTVQKKQHHIDDVELENLELRQYPSDEDFFDHKQHQSQDTRDIVKRITPSGKDEGKGISIDSRIPELQSNEWWAVDAVPKESLLTASDVTGKDRSTNVDNIEIPYVHGPQIFTESGVISFTAPSHLNLEQRVAMFNDEL